MKPQAGAPNSEALSVYVKDGFQTIIQRFQSSVQQFPNQTALVVQEKALSYKELDEYSDRLAFELVRKGIPMETMVPMFCTRSAEAIISMLGILKAGCAYVPVIPDYPDDRITFILEETKAPIFICESPTHQRAQCFGLPVINVSALPKEAAPVKLPDVTPDNLAYVLYTSGSTGKPKGVMIEHKGVDNQICSFQEFLPLPPGSNSLSLLPFVFDASVWEIYLPLFFGSPLFLIETHFALELDSFIDFLEENDIQSCYFPASLLTPLTQKLSKRPPLNVKRAIPGAEPLKQRVWDDFKRCFKNLELVNVYGPTEITIGTTYYQSGADIPPEGRVPIGKPIAGYTIYLVNENGQFCKTGETGEIWVAGVGVGRGYVKTTPKNKGRYTTDPFHPDGGRLYKTGDLAHYLPDGNLAFDRRKDLQVKVRGHRIELGEVEVVMEQIPDLLEAVAITRQDNNGANYLVGYFRKAEHANISAKEIREGLSRKVPAYMIPTQIIELKEFPRTINGKIDRRNLPFSPLEEAKVIVAPATPVEQRLLSMWQSVFGFQN
ncbi:MAG: amino acid adenylation domain-containing protein, partial [Mameliella sp.]|nr:amino acid adenylation domain-containing protein [Phaeodactylibacter sp.]